jgi:predicted permease
VTGRPRLAAWLVRAAIRQPESEFLLGDLDEQLEAMPHPLHARLWYWRQTLRAVWHLGVRRRRQAAIGSRRRGDSMVRHLIADLGFALRLLVRQPVYASVGVISLAIAIGANGLVFGLVDNLVFSPFQFPDADRLVSIGSTFPRLNADEGFIEQHSPAEIDDFRRAATLRHVAAFDLGNRAVSNGSAAERVFTVLALDDPLPAMGLPPALGRGFTAAELAPSGPAVAIISHGLWTRLFGQDRDIVGRAILVNSQPREVVGVTAAGASLLGADLWIPWGADPALVPRNGRQYAVIARLAPEATLDAANTELAAIAAAAAARFRAAFPEYDGWRVRVATWTEALTGQAMAPARILLGAGVLVLLVAGANLTTLMLTRLSARRREIAVRYALGARGWQVTRLLFVESAAMALAATVLGLALAWMLLPAVVAMLPIRLANLGNPTIDLRAIAYAALVGIAVAGLTAAVPAWQARRAAPQHTLRDGATTTGARQRLRRALVVAELALAVVLLVGAGLLLRSYERIQNIDPGVRTDHLLTMRLTLAPERYGSDDDTRRFFREFAERLQALPEVAHAAAASQFPPQQPFSIQFRVDGTPPPPGTLPTTLATIVTTGYFETMEIPIRSGRPLDERDRAGSPLAVVVNEAFADRFLGGRGTGRLLLTTRQAPAEVVGVAANTRNDSLLRPPQPELYTTIDQGPFNNQLFLLLRTRTDPSAALPSVRRTLAAMDPDQPLYLIQTMEQAIAGSLATQRISLSLVAGFAAAALVIACVGVYGVVSYWVAMRSREIGIRLALGASARQVTRLVAGETVRVVGVGAAIGLTAGVLLGRAVGAQLYETSPADPLALAGVALVLGLVGFSAWYLPSRRAVSVDPVTVLRSD